MLTLQKFFIWSHCGQSFVHVPIPPPPPQSPDCEQDSSLMYWQDTVRGWVTITKQGTASYILDGIFGKKLIARPFSKVQNSVKPYEFLLIPNVH